MFIFCSTKLTSINYFLIASSLLTSGNYLTNKSNIKVKLISENLPLINTLLTDKQTYKFVASIYLYKNKINKFYTNLIFWDNYNLSVTFTKNVKLDLFQNIEYFFYLQLDTIWLYIIYLYMLI